MVNTSFDKFLQLVQLDNQIYESYQDQNKLINLKSQFQAQISQLRSELELSNQNYVDLQKKCDSIDLDLKTIDSQIIKAKNKLSNVSSEKEYFSLEQELKLLSSKRLDIEEQLLSCWDERDLSKDNNKKDIEQIKSNIEDFSLNIKKTENRIEYLSKQIEELEVSRASNEEGIDSELLNNYHNMKQRVYNPVVHVDNQNCSACFFSLTKHDLAKLKQNTIITCSNCYRFLYTK